MSRTRTHSWPEIHHTAIIGNPPESRDYWYRIAAGEHIDLHAPEFGNSVRVEKYVTIDAGLTRPTHIGRGCFILSHAHIGHDAIIEYETEIATGAIIGGHARIGPRCKIGLGAIILPHRNIGQGATIGAGSVVTHDVPAGATVCGSPARRITPNPVPHTKRNLHNRLVKHQAAPNVACRGPLAEGSSDEPFCAHCGESTGQMVQVDGMLWHRDCGRVAHDIERP